MGIQGEFNPDFKINNMKNELIFDVDGTLWNACPASAKGWNKGLEILGISERVTVKDIESVAGNPYEKCVEMLLPGLQEKYPTLLDVFNKYEKEVVQAEGGVFYEGALTGIQELLKEYPVFLVSNCQDWYLKLFLQLSKLEESFCGYDCHGMSKLPKHEMIKNMTQKYSLKNPIYIGDTLGDQKAAKLSNTEFIHVSYGFGNVDDSDLSFNSFDNLVNYLKNK